nr:MAG TPA: hypothetical protein [Bacteriophage sp.]
MIIICIFLKLSILKSLFKTINYFIVCISN